MGRQQPLLRVQDGVHPADFKPTTKRLKLLFIFQGKCKIANFPGAIHEQGGHTLEAHFLKISWP